MRFPSSARRSSLRSRSGCFGGVGSGASRRRVARFTTIPNRPSGLSDASLSFTHLRRAARRRHRQGGAAFRLVPPHPRSWRAAVHRSARPLWPHASGGRPRQPGVQVGRDAARGMGGAHRRQGAQTARRHREPGDADRSGRGLYRRDRSAGPGGRIADAGVRRARLSGRDQAQIPFPRSAARKTARQYHAARAGDRTRSAAA